MKLKEKIMQILVTELRPNQMGAFYLMRLGIEIPDSITKNDLTHIIYYLCDKLCWIEEDNKTSITDTKSCEENQENNLSSDMSIKDSDKDKMPSMEWIGVENSDKEEESFYKTLALAWDDPDDIDYRQADEMTLVQNESTNVLKSDIKMNPIEKSDIKEDSLEKPGGTHTIEKPFICTYCNKGFEDAFGLKTHEKHCAKGSSGSLCCPHCGKQFTKSQRMRRHIRTQHTHPDYKPFFCSHCGEAFRESSKLKVHEMNHTGEKPFSCSKCDSKYTTSASLRMHERYHRDLPFSCSRCDKKFPVKSLLDYHELTHDDAKPFKCSECDQKYVNHSGLRRHKINHHKNSCSK